MRAPLTASLVAASLSLAGCTCGEDTTVPFHRGGEPTLRGTDPAATLLPLEAAAHAEGTRGLPVEGATLRIEDGSIRASGLYDFDRDGDRDVLFVVLGAANAAARVFYAEQRPGELATPAALASRATLSIQGGAQRIACAPTQASVSALSPGLVLVQVEGSCEDPASPRLSVYWVLSSDERPRALETFDFLGRSEGEGLSFAAHDRDQDEHDDVEVEARVWAEGGALTTTMTWMSRAAGLAREGDQPEPTIAGLATQARDAVRRTPEEALQTSARVIALRDALCREAERARFWVGGTRGIPCGASASSGRAYAVRAAALARRLSAGAPTDRAALEAALDDYVTLDHHGVSIREGDRALVRESWMRLASVPPERLVVHRGPEVVPVSTRPAPRLSTLAFVDEDRLLVRGAEPRYVVLSGSDARVEPAPAEAGEARMLDRDRALELVAIERRCEGTVLVIAPASGVVDAATGDRRELVVASRTPPAAADCPAIPEGYRADNDGFVALGWAPQGIVLARGSRVTVVPIDAAGAALGAPSVLPETVPAPAPLAPGAALADAHAYALATPFGIVVVDRAERTVAIYRDEDFAVPQGLSTDVALSPSAARAAWLCGGALCWADLRASDTTAPPAPEGPPEMPADQRQQQPGAPPTTPTAAPGTGSPTAPR